MLRLLRKPFEWVRRRPVASVLVLLLALGVLTVAGAEVWAMHAYEEAGRDMAEDRLDEASGQIGFCLAVWPWSADAHFRAAQIDRLRAAFPEAEKQLDECRRLQGQTARMQLEVLLLRAERGEVDKVGDDLLYAARQDKADERGILEALARGDMRQMRYLPARVLLDECLDHYPDDVHALDWRGWVEERLGQQEKAAEDYKRALELSPDRFEVRIRLAELYLDHSDPVQAEPHLLKLAKIQPKRPDVLVDLARCRFLQGRFDEARGLLDRALAAEPEGPTALLYRGKLEMQTEPPKPEAAEAYYRRALKTDPNNVEVHHALYDSLRVQPGRSAEADTELKRYNELADINRRIERLMTNEVEQASTNPAPAYELGKLNLELGNDDAGLYWLTKVALARDPNHKPTHALLADYFEKKGDKQAAEIQRALAGK